MERPPSEQSRTESIPVSASRWPLVALAALIGVGLALRLLLIDSARPAFAGARDAAWYMIAASDGVFVLSSTPNFSPWPAGYPAFLWLVQHVAPEISFAVLLQHVLGLFTAVVLFLTVRRIVSAWWALLPAAVVLLAGPQLFLEHSPMAEVLFAFLLAVVLYASVRLYDAPVPSWALVAGVALGCAGCVRLQGLPLTGVLGVWILVGIKASARDRAVVFATALVGFSLVIGGYLAEMKHQTGFGGPALTRSGSFSAPDDGRPSHFAERLAPDLIRLWDSEANYENGGLGYEGFIVGLTTPQGTPMFAQAQEFYPTLTLSRAGDALPFLQGYERHTRVEGIPFMVLLLLGAGGLVAARGRRLRLSALVFSMAVVAVMSPLMFAQFDARYIVPAYGVLAASGAIGGATLWNVLSPRLRRVPLVKRVPAAR